MIRFLFFILPLAVLFPTAAPAQAPAHYPDFSWDTVPVYKIFGDGARLLAKAQMMRMTKEKIGKSKILLLNNGAHIPELFEIGDTFMFEQYSPKLLIKEAILRNWELLKKKFGSRENRRLAHRRGGGRGGILPFERFRIRAPLGEMKRTDPNG